jgi:osmotically-inducible protein OsmY
MDDRSISERVAERLKNEPTYKFTDVDVRTFGGVVQLSGFVNTDEQKSRAGELAQGVGGVSKVINNISLKPETLTPTGQGKQY